MPRRRGNDVRQLFEVTTRPIDPVFESVYEEGPFTRCLECERPFVQENDLLSFIIMKVFVHDQTIIELAICEECRSKMREELSAESTKAIERFLARRFHPAATIDVCAICDRARDVCRSSTLYAQCIGEEMIVHQTPFMICDRCEEALQELLSDETRGWQDDFMNRHFSGPSLERNPNLNPVFI